MIIQVLNNIFTQTSGAHKDILQKLSIEIIGHSLQTIFQSQLYSTRLQSSCTNSCPVQRGIIIDIMHSLTFSFTNSDLFTTYLIIRSLVSRLIRSDVTSMPCSLISAIALVNKRSTTTDRNDGQTYKSKLTKVK